MPLVEIISKNNTGKLVEVTDKELNKLTHGHTHPRIKSSKRIFDQELLTSLWERKDRKASPDLIVVIE